MHLPQLRFALQCRSLFVDPNRRCKSGSARCVQCILSAKVDAALTWVPPVPRTPISGQSLAVRGPEMVPAGSGGMIRNLPANDLSHWEMGRGGREGEVC